MYIKIITRLFNLVDLPSNRKTIGNKCISSPHSNYCKIGGFRIIQNGR